MLVKTFTSVLLKEPFGWLKSFSPSRVSVKGLSLEHPYWLVVRSRFLSSHSGVLQFAAATEFDNLEAAELLHELSAIASEGADQEDGGGGV